MSIDTGQNLHYNQNFPEPGKDQPSQQFRDNFGVLKTAVEFLQTMSNGTASIFTVTSSQNAGGAITLDIGLKNNAFTLPVNGGSSSPSTGSAVTGMIRYNTVNTDLEYFTGGAWRRTTYQGGDATFGTVIANARVTIPNAPTVGSDAVNKAYVDNTFVTTGTFTGAGLATNANVALIANSVTAEVQRAQAAEAGLANSISNVSTIATTALSQANTAVGQLGSISNAITAEQTRAMAAEANLLSLNTNNQNRISNAEANVATLTSDLATEVTNRIGGDQYLYDRINAVVITGNASTSGLAAEIVARQNGDQANADNLTNTNNNLADEIADRIQGDIDTLNTIGGKLDTAGGDMFGDLNMGNSAINVDGGTINLTNSAVLSIANSSIELPGSDFKLDAGRMFYLAALPNTHGGGDGAFITYDENNFSYALISDSLRSDINNSIVANGLANTNAMYEFSCLRIGSTNDPANGANDDSVAIEPAAHLYLNPGHAGTVVTDVANGGIIVDTRTPTANSKIIVGNAISYTLTIDRDTGTINSKGDIVAQGDVIGASDASLKSNVRQIENALDKIEALRGVVYTRNDLPGEPEQIGLIAQDTQAVIPQVVHEMSNGLLGVSYGNLTALLIEGIRELRAEIRALNARLD